MNINAIHVLGGASALMLVLVAAVLWSSVTGAALGGDVAPLEGPVAVGGLY